MALEFEWDWEQKERDAWAALIEIDPTLFEEGCMLWRSMAGLGFPDYICFEDGRVFEMNHDRTDLKQKNARWSNPHGVYRISLKRPQVVGGRRVANAQVQVSLHILVATLFCDRPEGSRRVKFLNNLCNQPHASNLFWV